MELFFQILFPASLSIHCFSLFSRLTSLLTALSSEIPSRPVLFSPPFNVLAYFLVPVFSFSFLVFPFSTSLRSLCFLPFFYCFSLLSLLLLTIFHCPFLLFSLIFTFLVLFPFEISFLFFLSCFCLPLLSLCFLFLYLFSPLSSSFTIFSFYTFSFPSYFLSSSFPFVFLLSPSIAFHLPFPRSVFTTLFFALLYLITYPYPLHNLLGNHL